MYVQRDEGGNIVGQFSERQPGIAEEWMPNVLPLPPLPLTRAQVEVVRLRAYADPIHGSDRYFAEAQRESLLGNAEAAEAAKELGQARFAEIQSDNPWPAE